MRIALLSWESKHSIAVGGLAEHVSELGVALHDRGHEVHLFTRIGPGQSGYEHIDGVHYHRCPYEPHPDFLVDNERMCNSFVWHLAETESFLSAPFDIVHGHDWLSVRALQRAKNDHGRSAVMTMHSTEFGRCGNQLFEGQSRRIRELEWEGAYVAERVICVSGALRSEIGDLYNVPADKADVIYNGVDVSRFDAKVSTRQARRHYSIGADDPMILFAGRMTRQKGPDILVEALPNLLADHPKAKFVFAGEGDLRVGLERRVADLGVAPATRFVGHRAGRDLVTLFKSADLVCVPSRNEPFGIVILEAWSARKPVVATLNGGPAEFVKHEDTGLTVSDDRDAIGWGVGTVLADRTMGRQMGSAGRREAEAHFSWDVIAGETERVYQSVLDARSDTQELSGTQTEEVYGMARKQTGTSTTKAGPPKRKTSQTTTVSRAKTTSKTTAKPSRTPVKAPVKQTRTVAKTSRVSQKSMLASDLLIGGEPTSDEIRERAYQIFLARGSTPGSSEGDWLQAERELRELKVARVATTKQRRR